MMSHKYIYRYVIVIPDHDPFLTTSMAKRAKGKSKSSNNASAKFGDFVDMSKELLSLYHHQVRNLGCFHL